MACSTVACSTTSSQPMASRRRRAARWRACPAGDGAVQREHDVELVGAQRRQHLARVAALQAADHQDAPAGGVEVVEEHRGARVGAGRVVRAVDDDERLVAEHLEAAGHDHLGEALGDDVAGHRRGEERLDGGERDGGVVALVAAVQRHEHTRGRPWWACAGRPSGRRAPAGSRARRSRSPRTRLAAPPAVDEDLHQLGVGLADHHRAAGLDDARLLGGDVRRAWGRRTRCGRRRCW